MRTSRFLMSKKHIFYSELIAFPPEIKSNKILKSIETKEAEK